MNPTKLTLKAKWLAESEDGFSPRLWAATELRLAFPDVSSNTRKTALKRARQRVRNSPPTKEA